MVAINNAKHLLLIVADGIAGRLDAVSCYDLAGVTVDNYIDHFYSSLKIARESPSLIPCKKTHYLKGDIVRSGYVDGHSRGVLVVRNRIELLYAHL